MLEEVDKAYRHCQRLKTAVVHVDAEEEGQLLIERIKDRYPGLSPDSCPVGPVVGAHIGPGTLGVLLLSFNSSALRYCQDIKI